MRRGLASTLPTQYRRTVVAMSETYVERCVELDIMVAPSEVDLGNGLATRTLPCTDYLRFRLPALFRPGSRRSHHSDCR